MRQQLWFNLVAATTVVAVLGAGILSLAVAGHGATSSSGGGNSSPTVFRNLTIAYDPATGQFNYNTRDLTVPVGVTVVFTVTNYDPSVGSLPAPGNAAVTGTVGGTMQMHRGMGGASMAALPANGVSHTFTMWNGFYHLNVPIPPAASASSPSVVSFSVVFTSPGTYSWGCVILCGDGSGMPDQMFGAATVR